MDSWKVFYKEKAQYHFNQYEKDIGRRIWDSTNSRYMSATGSGATSTWEPESVGTAVTPS